METNNINEVHLIQRAESVHRLIEEEKLQGLPLSQRLTSEEDPQVLLSKLLQQLETLQGTGTREEVTVFETDSIAPDYADVNPDELISTRSELNNEVADEIIKELKKVKRQNFVTHCLLTAILVLTLVGQLSEIALISRVRRGLNNPVKAIGGLLLGMIKRPGNGKNKVKEAASANESHSHSVPKIKMEIPHVHIPEFRSVED